MCRLGKNTPEWGAGKIAFNRTPYVVLIVEQSMADTQLPRLPYFHCKKEKKFKAVKGWVVTARQWVYVQCKIKQFL